MKSPPIFLSPLFGIWALLSKPTSANLITAYIIGTAIGAMIIIILFRKYFIGLLANFNFHLIKTILSNSLPIRPSQFSWRHNDKYRPDNAWLDENC